MAQQQTRDYGQVVLDGLLSLVHPGRVGQRTMDTFQAAYGMAGAPFKALGAASVQPEGSIPIGQMAQAAFGTDKQGPPVDPLEKAKMDEIMKLRKEQVREAYQNGVPLEHMATQVTPQQLSTGMTGSYGGPMTTSAPIDQQVLQFMTSQQQQAAPQQQQAGLPMQQGAPQSLNPYPMPQAENPLFGLIKGLYPILAIPDMMAMQKSRMAMDVNKAYGETPQGKLEYEKAAVGPQVDLAKRKATEVPLTASETKTAEYQQGQLQTGVAANQVAALTAESQRIEQAKTSATQLMGTYKQIRGPINTFLGGPSKEMKGLQSYLDALTERSQEVAKRLKTYRSPNAKGGSSKASYVRTGKLPDGTPVGMTADGKVEAIR